MQQSSKTGSISISKHLLWEFDLDSFDFNKSRFLVIERVVERGNLEDWQIIYQTYGQKEILAVVEESKQLSKRDKDFTHLFINSPLLHAA